MATATIRVCHYDTANVRIFKCNQIFEAIDWVLNNCGWAALAEGAAVLSEVSSGYAVFYIDVTTKVAHLD